MALETRLLQKLSQNLLMTPQLQQAIKLLQLGRLEYLEAIQKELLENPLLEEMKEDGAANSQEANSQQTETVPTSLANETPASDSEGSSSGESDSSEGSEVKVDWENYLDNFSDYSGSATPKGLVDYEDRPQYDASLTRGESLVEHLLAQLRLADIPEEQKEICINIVGNLDKNGYLCASHEEIAEDCQCSIEEIEKALEVIRQFDPPGVAARDLGECLSIQLDLLGLEDSLATRIVQNYLDKLEKRRYDLIAKAEHVEIEEVYKAVNTIRKLEPHPGRPFAEDATRYVIPDIYVYKVGNEYVITLNEDGLPRLRISPYYLQLLKDGDSSSAPNKTYLQERLKAASWLIRSIMQRQQTIYKVTESIFKFQRSFLEHGVSKLRPLVLKDVADDISMHESTVSRVTTNKYVHTPQGVFELKYFFTTGIKTAEGDVSSSTIKEKIKAIIASENPENPISDQGIVDLLKKENIDIARRTVAKYRESLGVESSSRRKKLF